MEEGLFHGKFCIAHDTSGHREQIVHGENGWLVNMKELGWKESVKEAVNLPVGRRLKVMQNAAQVRKADRGSSFIETLRKLS